MKKRFPYQYKNGPVTVTIEKDGTKTRTWDDEKYGMEPELEFPESIDYKCTNFCDLGCLWCHEKSTTNGQHADLHKFADMLERSNWPAGIEMAVGGGNPLAHPFIDDFLEFCDGKEWLVNMTVNWKHLMSDQKHHHLVDLTYKEYVFHCFEMGYIQGLGISISPKEAIEHIEDLAEVCVKSKNNVVLHFIEGIHSYTDVTIVLKAMSNYILLKNLPITSKLLILGKKDFGRYSLMSEGLKAVMDSKSEEWKREIDNFLKLVTKYGGIVSFDNLAIERLGVLKNLPEEFVKTHYMGSEGTHTMYIDGVKEEYAINSTATTRFPIGDKTIREVFKDIYNKRKELQK